MFLDSLPKLNATLNLIASILLMRGYFLIKYKNNRELHKKFMLASLVVSALFLISYLYYHYNAGHSSFPELGLIKTLYLIILIPHIILAVGMLPLIFLTFYFAFKNNLIRHKKLAKITFPIWLYVSITGVMIYLMNYVIAPILVKNM